MKPKEQIPKHPIVEALLKETALSVGSHQIPCLFTGVLLGLSVAHDKEAQEALRKAVDMFAEELGFSQETVKVRAPDPASCQQPNPRELEVVPDYCDHMTLADWQKLRSNGFFLSDDGYGYYSDGNHLDRSASVWNPGPPPSWATHVAWFNK